MRVGREWNRKGGRRNKNSKKGGKQGRGVSALKTGDWNPLTNCEHYSTSLRIEIYILNSYF